MLDRYLAQVGRLLTVLPEIARETAFALKGGTAINVGMTREAVSLAALADTARTLHADIVSRPHGDVATFLLSLHDAEPDFGLLGLPEAANLPAVRWKLINLKKLRDTNPAKHAAQRGALKGLFR